MSDQVKVRVKIETELSAPFGSLSNIPWRIGKPEKSGDYLILYVNEAGCCHFAEIEYSAKYKLWNCSDYTPEDVCKRRKDWNVLFWAACEEIIPKVTLEKEEQQ